jgi:hypothetical protein
MDPVTPPQFVAATASAALTVTAGAAYALLFALGRLWGDRRLGRAAYLAYALLAGAVLTLAASLQLTGIWQWLVGVMLAGYLLAPHGVWRLCVGTHSRGGGRTPR